ncbi:MAG: hypothetical protein KGI06_00910 [Candidatus Micrarchaeota archaeon]|nr:hypothetical protein [Candidatus Micrarchaeota archaeon]
MATKDIEAAETKREEIRSMGETIVILAPKQWADLAGTISILEANGMRLLKEKESFAHIMQTKELGKRLAGEWFFIDGRGTDKKGYYNVRENGDLVKFGIMDHLLRNFKDPEGIAHASSGNWSLCMAISPPNHMAMGRQFELMGGISPEQRAPVAVGIRESRKAAGLLRYDK